MGSNPIFSTMQHDRDGYGRACKALTNRFDSCMLLYMKQWFAANVPILSKLLMKVCRCGGSVVKAEWRWRRCK